MNTAEQPTGPTAIFVSLEPDAELAAQIERYKQRVKALAGDQLYLSDPPHLTVYLAMFASVDRFLQSWPASFNRLDPVELELEAWRVFYADALTGRNTLVCEITDEGKQRLRELQQRVVAQVAPARDREPTERRYAARWNALDETQRRQVSMVGFPYIGAGWLPHFTIASIDTAAWPRVWAELESHGPHGRFTCSRLQPYRLVNEHPVPLRMDGLVG